MKDTIIRCMNLAKGEKKTMVEKVCKLTEETGELAQAVLSYQNAPGCGYKGKTKLDVVEEAIDGIIMNLSIIDDVYDHEADVEEIKNIFNSKLDKWEKVSKVDKPEVKETTIDDVLNIIKSKMSQHQYEYFEEKVKLYSECDKGAYFKIIGMYKEYCNRENMIQLMSVEIMKELIVHGVYHSHTKTHINRSDFRVGDVVKIKHNYTDKYIKMGRKDHLAIIKNIKDIYQSKDSIKFELILWDDPSHYTTNWEMSQFDKYELV